MNEFTQDIKLNYPLIATLPSSKRFLKYRCLDVICDMDRSKEAYKAYKKLNWWNLESPSNLEPDTFIISGWVILRKALKAYDNNYYLNNYKAWFIKEISLDFENTSKKAHRAYRFQWLNLREVQEHYNGVLSNQSINQLLELTHSPANLMIIPKYFGRIKCMKFNELFDISLLELENNFTKYRNNYLCIGINSFSELVERFCLKCCYTKNDKEKYILKESLKDLEISRFDTFDSIIEKCNSLINLVKDRATEMQLYSNNIGRID